MSCGCQNQCLCLIEGADGVMVVGDGSTATPYVISPPAETVFDASNADGTILITPGGPDGHEPVIDLVIDPASTAPVSKSVAGLRIDCCSPATGGTGEDLPTGVILDFAGSTPPPGFLLCDGSSVQDQTYVDLFAVIGTTYGSAGLGFFNLPDLRGRVSAGPDDMGTGAAGRITAANTLGASAGAQSHTLSSAQMPTHTHAGSSAGAAGTHNHLVGWNQVQGDIDNSPPTPDNYVSGLVSNAGGTNQSTTDTVGNHTHPVTVGLEGGGGSHNNLQPYLILNKIIKT